MSAAEIALVAIAVLVVVTLVLVNLARRVDRLHRRVVSSRAVLEEQLVRRAEAAAELAATGALDPASSVIVAQSAWEAAVHAPRLVGGDDTLADDGVARGLAESQLVISLRAALGGPAERAALTADEHAARVLDELEQATYRVELARRFTTTPSSRPSICAATRSCARSGWPGVLRCP